MLMSDAKPNVLQYPAVFNPADGGGYEVSFPDFPGCVTFGKNFEEAKEKAQEVLSLWLEEMREHHEEVPRHDSRPILDEVSVPAPSS